ncbi:hypothetical protein Tco_1356574, partial [Tanacetum coccineum]
MRVWDHRPLGLFFLVIFLLLFLLLLWLLQRLSTIAPVISFAAPMVETTLVASPTGLCDLVPYTGSDSDSPDEMTSPEHISPLPAHSYALILLMNHHCKTLMLLPLLVGEAG